MNSKDIMELRRRLTKNEVTIQRMAGCFVDEDHNKVCTINETFLNLPEETFYKYLDIAKDIFRPKKVNENMLELGLDEDRSMYEALLSSKLKNEDVLESFYNTVIEGNDYCGKYLILVFYDAYDVMTRTSDNAELDESEEVYEYITCAICPVTLTKPGLAYDDGKNEIDVRVRDWVVSMPEKGFIWPAFTERSTDKDHIMWYTRDSKEPDTAIMSYMKAIPRRTITQKQAEIFAIVKGKLMNEDELEMKTIAKFEANLERSISEGGEDADKKEIKGEQIEGLFKNTTFYDGIEKDIAKEYEKRFAGDYPKAGELLNKKYIELGISLEERQEKVKTLRRTLLLLEKDHSEETVLIDNINKYIAWEER